MNNNHSNIGHDANNDHGNLPKQAYDDLRWDNLTKSALLKLNSSKDLKFVLSTILRLVKELSGCEAAAIRIADNGDYPYFVHDGFSDVFVKKENFLCARDENNNRIEEPNGKGYILECMCGNILRGRFNPALEFFTQNGSFWSNHTSQLLAETTAAETTAEETQGNPRKYCVACGYESIALIPIKSFDEIIGLIQINDKKKDKFDAKKIEFFELLGNQIGLAVKTSWYSTKCKESEEIAKILERTELLKSEFIVNISHELRTPIHIILSSISLMNLNLEKARIIDPTNACSKNLKLIKQNCYRLIRLINNLIDTSRIDAGQFTLKMQKYNLVHFIEKIVLSVKTHIEEKDRKLIFIENTEQAFVLCDLEALERIVLNLLANALKFSPKDSDILIEVSRTEKSFRCSISDYGIGIPLEKQALIFDRFKQLENIMTKNHEGSGIGLSLVNSLVLMQHGKIHVKSIPGEGSTFTLEFPLLPQDSEEQNIAITKQENFLQESKIEAMLIEFSDIYT